MSRRYLAVVLLSLCLSACGAAEQFQQVMAQATAASAKIKDATGRDAAVNINITNGVTSVTVTFKDAPPDAALSELIAKTRAALASELKPPPQHIIVAFHVGP